MSVKHAQNTNQKQLVSGSFFALVIIALTFGLIYFLNEVEAKRLSFCNLAMAPTSTIIKESDFVNSCFAGNQEKQANLDEVSKKISIAKGQEIIRQIKIANNQKSILTNNDLPLAWSVLKKFDQGKAPFKALSQNATQDAEISSAYKALCNCV